MSSQAEELLVAISALIDTKISAHFVNSHDKNAGREARRAATVDCTQASLLLLSALEHLTGETSNEPDDPDDCITDDEENDDG